MTQVIKNINSSPKWNIVIIVECDTICSCCPHNKGEVCQKRPHSPQKMRNIDMHVLRKVGLREGTKGNFKDIISLVNTRLKYISDIQDVCGDCDWKEKCLWFMQRATKNILSDGNTNIPKCTWENHSNYNVVS